MVVAELLSLPPFKTTEGLNFFLSIILVEGFSGSVSRLWVLFLYLVISQRTVR